MEVFIGIIIANWGADRIFRASWSIDNVPILHFIIQLNKLSNIRAFMDISLLILYNLINFHHGRESVSIFPQLLFIMVLE